QDRAVVAVVDRLADDEGAAAGLGDGPAIQDRAAEAAEAAAGAARVLDEARVGNRAHRDVERTAARADDAAAVFEAAGLDEEAAGPAGLDEPAVVEVARADFQLAGGVDDAGRPVGQAGGVKMAGARDRVIDVVEGGAAAHLPEGERDRAA